MSSDKQASPTVDANEATRRAVLYVQYHHWSPERGIDQAPPEDCAVLWLAIQAQRLIVAGNRQTLADSEQTLSVLETAYTQQCGPLPQ